MAFPRTHRPDVDPSSALIVANRMKEQGVNWCSCVQAVRGVIFASGLKRDVFTAGNDIKELYAPQTSKERCVFQSGICLKLLFWQSSPPSLYSNGNSLLLIWKLQPQRLRALLLVQVS